VTRGDDEGTTGAFTLWITCGQPVDNAVGGAVEVRGMVTKSMTKQCDLWIKGQYEKLLGVIHRFIHRLWTRLFTGGEGVIHRGRGVIHRGMWKNGTRLWISGRLPTGNSVTRAGYPQGCPHEQVFGRTDVRFWRAEANRCSGANIRSVAVPKLSLRSTTAWGAPC
jgi:hypothetical protein